MVVSGQAQDLPAKPGRYAGERGPRVRMRRHMLETAIRLMKGGMVPSVSDVAEAAEVSRATAYRYFPSQAAMIQAVVDEALRPVFEWSPDGDDPEQRVAELVAFSYPRLMNSEATHRAALSLALSQWARKQAGTLSEPPVVRGNRKLLLREAAAPLRGNLDAQTFDKLAQSLSLIFGIEAIIVLKDIWGLEPDEAQSVAVWAAGALVRAARAEVPAAGNENPPTGTNLNAAPRPRNNRKRS